MLYNPLRDTVKRCVKKYVFPQVGKQELSLIAVAYTASIDSALLLSSPSTAEERVAYVTGVPRAGSHTYLAVGLHNHSDQLAIDLSFIFIFYILQNIFNFYVVNHFVSTR